MYRPGVTPKCTAKVGGANSRRVPRGTCPAGLFHCLTRRVGVLPCSKGCMLRCIIASYTACRRRLLCETCPVLWSLGYMSNAVLLQVMFSTDGAGTGGNIGVLGTAVRMVPPLFAIALDISAACALVASLSTRRRQAPATHKAQRSDSMHAYVAVRIPSTLSNVKPPPLPG